VSNRELVVLGTASQAPTRARNHNGYTDLLVCESTFADADAALAVDYGHLTAGQAGEIAAAASARRLILTHFSQRYDEADALEQLRKDAAAAYDGDIVLAADLDRVPVPPR
jgi:ribonuclease Z